VRALLSGLIYAPREHYTTRGCRRNGRRFLGRRFNGQQCGVNVGTVGIGAERIRSALRTQPGQIPRSTRASSKKKGGPPALSWSRRAGRWDEDLKAGGIEASARPDGIQLLRRFGGAFPGRLREDESSRPGARADVELIEPDQRITNRWAMQLYRPLKHRPATCG